MVNKKKLVYTAHSSETEKYSEYIFKFVFDKGALSLDPYLTIPTYMLTWICCKGDRRCTLAASINLLMRCDELWVFSESKHPRSIEKHGVELEIAWWKRFRDSKKIRYYT